MTRGEKAEPFSKHWKHTRWVDKGGGRARVKDNQTPKTLGSPGTDSGSTQKWLSVRLTGSTLVLARRSLFGLQIPCYTGDKTTHPLCRIFRSGFLGNGESVNAPRDNVNGLRPRRGLPNPQIFVVCATVRYTALRGCGFCEPPTHLASFIKSAKFRAHCRTPLTIRVGGTPPPRLEMLIVRGQKTGVLFCNLILVP